MGGGLPFSAEQFFAVFAAYNAAVWPAPVVAYALGAADIVALAYLRAVPAASLNAFIALSLALMWAWTGIAYHIAFFSAINAAAFGFGALFVLEAVAIGVAAVGGGVRFGGAPALDAVAGAFFVVYAMVLYPLIGMATGHAYPAAPVFGITPCPVTIFTFGLLLLTNGRVAWMVVVLPVAWSLIGGSAAVLLGVVQDWMLPIAALATVALLARRQMRASAPSAAR